MYKFWLQSNRQIQLRHRFQTIRWLTLPFWYMLTAAWNTATLSYPGSPEQTMTLLPGYARPHVDHKLTFCRRKRLRSSTCTKNAFHNNRIKHLLCLCYQLLFYCNLKIASQNNNLEKYSRLKNIGLADKYNTYTNLHINVIWEANSCIQLCSAVWNTLGLSY